ncbi:MAG: tetratricopeptide repeat protein [Pseudomonadota bacterium]
MKKRIIEASVLLAALCMACSVFASQTDEHFLQGYKLGMARKWLEAIDHYSKTIAADPQHVEAHFQRAVTLEMVNRTPEAIADYEKVVSFRPDHYLAVEYLARAYDKVGDYQKALDTYNRALNLTKNAKWKSIIQWWMARAKQNLQSGKRPDNDSRAGQPDAQTPVN